MLAQVTSGPAPAPPGAARAGSAFVADDDGLRVEFEAPAPPRFGRAPPSTAGSAADRRRQEAEDWDKAINGAQAIQWAGGERYAPAGAGGWPDVRTATADP